MAAAPRLMSVDEYFRTPESVLPQELVYGAMRVADAPLPRHQMAVAQLFRALDAHVRERQLGQVWLAPLDVILDETAGLIVQPDLFFVSNERAGIVRDRVRGAPDLVIEVLSPEPRIGRVEERVAWFATFDVRECWLVHQDERAVVVLEFLNCRIAGRHRFGPNDHLTSSVLPDFMLSLRDILAAA